MTALYTLGGLLVLAALTVCLKLIRLARGRKRALAEIAGTRIESLAHYGAVKECAVLPLLDFHAARPGLKTEPGVSCLVKAGALRILMDTGYNAAGEHPSPLLDNMKALGVDPEALDMIFISHAHLDHLGGMKEQRTRTFSISRGKVKLGKIPVFAPVDIRPSAYNPGPVTQVVSWPQSLAPGVISIGAIPRELFLMGPVREQSLAVHVKGKGIALIIGCGHQTIERIVERARLLFREPVFAVIGGLHFPVRGGRVRLGPLNIQKLVGSDLPPWRGLSEADVEKAIVLLKSLGLKVLALSPHDSSDWALGRFRDEFPGVFRTLSVGEEIRL
ncbi:MAG: MBL fold metallo-hydrolase [Spirochaetes bacterium]|nr:MAG: MBL fold metallo-hydrolase [Spirochaetota bacterium]